MEGMNKIFSLVRAHRGQRLDYTPLLDGQWWVLDFADVEDMPGLTYRVNLQPPSPAHGQLIGLRQLMWRRGLKLQTRRVPALDVGTWLVRLHVRVLNPDDFYKERSGGL